MCVVDVMIQNILSTHERCLKGEKEGMREIREWSEKRCENPHKTTKQLSSTNLIFFQFCTAEALETVFALSIASA